VLEAIERTEHLISLVPSDRLAWRPEWPAGLPPAADLGHTLGHLLDCVAGFCAALHRAFPTELADFEDLRKVCVNALSSPEDVRAGLRTFAHHVERGFQCLTDADLGRPIPTVFVPQGEALLTLLLGNLEHLLNHKYQLFLYLKLAGVSVSTQDLYRFRGIAKPVEVPSAPPKGRL
jgi:hypothetical protein